METLMRQPSRSHDLDVSTWPDRPDLRHGYKPELPAWLAALTRWEEQHGRPHPRGDRLFRPPVVGS
jgi:hypothetical protein